MLLVVGVVTWGLIIWAAVVYRRRKGQTGLPVQLRYNLPIEIFYTIVPLILVLGFFAFTARDQAEIEARPGQPRRADRGLRQALGVGLQLPQRERLLAGVQAQERLERRRRPSTRTDFPVLYLPVDKKVEIEIESRDVMHSFWIIDFLYKKDMIPGEDQLHVLHPAEGRHLQGQVRRALR